jgi:hypothetical protein
MKAPIAMALLLFGINSFGTTTFAVCENRELGIRGVSDNGIGPMWRYTYGNQVFRSAAYEAMLATGGEIYDVSESDVAPPYIPDGGWKEHTSTKRVRLSKAGALVVEANVDCKGLYPYLAEVGR